MTTVINKNQKSSVVYQLFCMCTLFFGACYRFLKKATFGKNGKTLRSIYSTLAFGCLGMLVYLCALLESDGISLLRAALLSALFLGGFGLCCDLSGAFRSYRRFKKPQKDSLKNRADHLSIVKSQENIHKCA